MKNLFGHSNSPLRKKNYSLLKNFSSVQFSSVTQSCPTLCNPMNCTTPGLPVHHQLPEFTQTHVYRVGDAIQPSYPLSPPSPPAYGVPQSQTWLKRLSSSSSSSHTIMLPEAVGTLLTEFRKLWLSWQIYAVHIIQPWPAEQHSK